jgi:XapX domain-containing protein
MFDPSIILGIILGLTIGGVCRYFDLPLPAPPKFVGALIVLMMTLGFMLGAYL